MSAFLDLRSWLKHLDQQDRLDILKPGRQLEFEVAGIANRWDGRKATVFPQLGNRDGVIVSGLLSQRHWMAEALGTTESELLSRFQGALAKPLPWKEVANPPCQQVVYDEPDLTSMLPIPTHNEHDNGAYITAGLVITRNPKTGRQNVAIHRLQIQGPRQLGALLLPRHTLAYQQMAESEGHDLDVAIVIGSSPAALLSSQAIAPFDQDELEIAGALTGAPLEVAKCLGSELRVPATSEIIIEGRFLANTRELEGPFGEFPQYYAERAKRHVIEVDRVTTRERPLYHTIVGGSREHLLLGGIPREATILSTLQYSFPGVVDVHLPQAGSCRYHLYVKLKKRLEGEAKNVIMAALAAHYDVKHVFVVDEDVDIHSREEVEWALATRFQADRDLVVVHNTLGSKLDPSTDNGISSKLGFDLTVPKDVPEMKYLRIRVPGQTQIDLDAVAAPDADLKDFL
ncbi:MAG: UbiD family decarboxylase [Hyphomicrobiaceae bacterium TMED74]|nr:3-octaprenyl-4-hydroxybenzoate carboxy-lyase [Filomicrobium sp.]MAI45517.1 3-octaprenyl-4-hydroxybenzoate carboxy-lyase [Filomicrobium sp.]RPG43848.1 MAG: UbiD family decarboxylase [Hyphomicrobiaceae bacterium TMED74]RPG44077.1 MAG: UbiD family decarboxylase [Hyphomicrobiaceae bacterium TMED74]